MHTYDEFDEERDLKNMKTDSDVNEFGDKIKRSDIYAGIIFWVGLAGLATCAFFRGCQEVEKHISKNSVPAARVIHSTQNSR